MLLSSVSGLVWSEVQNGGPHSAHYPCRPNPAGQSMDPYHVAQMPRLPETGTASVNRSIPTARIGAVGPKTTLGGSLRSLYSTVSTSGGSSRSRRRHETGRRLCRVFTCERAGDVRPEPRQGPTVVYVRAMFRVLLDMIPSGPDDHHRSD